ncbi:MAG: pyridoxamine 5'-phosphate oxidase family protein [Gammaproteobacteria bacterium]|nr:pyridoxamine 5'-phosphate oxidase family protein [Gammaproteobacteria bacterium]
MHQIDSLEKLEQIYRNPVPERSLWKEIDHVNALYRQFIEASPFLILASSGKQGVDCSPRGDPPGFVRVVSPQCIQIPDRKGNNRLDSMRNIVENPAVAVIFLVPGAGETLRLAGQAEILVDEALCQSFAINGRPASSVLSIKVDKVYYQCQKALMRSKLWDPSERVEPGQLPSAGQLARHFSAEHGIELDAEGYDADYAEHLQQRIF